MPESKLLTTIPNPQRPEDERYLQKLLEDGVLYSLTCRNPGTYEVWQVGKV